MKNELGWAPSYSSKEYYTIYWFPISDQSDSWIKTEVLDTLFLLVAGDKARRPE